MSERLGHATVGFTLDTYTHAIEGMDEEAAVRIGTALRAAITKADKETAQKVDGKWTAKRNAERKVADGEVVPLQGR